MSPKMSFETIQNINFDGFRDGPILFDCLPRHHELTPTNNNEPSTRWQILENMSQCCTMWVDTDFSLHLQNRIYSSKWSSSTYPTQLAPWKTLLENPWNRNNQKSISPIKEQPNFLVSFLQTLVFRWRNSSSEENQVHLFRFIPTQFFWRQWNPTAYNDPPLGIDPLWTMG